LKNDNNKLLLFILKNDKRVEDVFIKIGGRSYAYIPRLFMQSIFDNTCNEYESYLIEEYDKYLEKMKDEKKQNMLKEENQFLSILIDDKEDFDEKIYNKVYEKNNYANDWNASSVTDGTYYFLLTVQNGNSYHGALTIIRSK